MAVDEALGLVAAANPEEEWNWDDSFPVLAVVVVPAAMIDIDDGS